MLLRKIQIITLFIFLALSVPCRGQSFAYKMLLKSVYDKDFPVIYPEDIKHLPNAVFLDTREKNEFTVSHLKGAKWVGFDSFTLDSVKEFPKNQPIVVYCSIGARSQEIGEKLISAGYSEIYNLYGGIFHWVNEENPVYTDQVKTEKVHVFNKTWSIWLKRGEKVY